MDFLEGVANLAAPRLLGCELERTLPDGTVLRGRIVETEAYDQADAASHSYKGPTRRSAAMFGPAGHAYVYFTYGMYYCMNVVVGPMGHGAGVLIRAIEPLGGVDVMRGNRKGRADKELTNGPGKLCQAMAIDMTLYGHDLRQPPLKLRARPALEASRIITTTRIGITKAKDMPWRFYVSKNPFVSRPNG